MSYYRVLGWEREAFSTSPDPAFFYRSTAHQAVIQRLEISIRLRRGLCLILGDVGTGKTTMSRILLKIFQEEPDFDFHMILDPRYKSEFQFLSALTRILNIPDPGRSTLDYKEAIEKHLFQKGVDENKTIVLLIDEGQELSPTMLECLRMLLNYETNEYKLLQLIIVGQLDLLPKVKRIRNFIDRVNLKYIINPLDLNETKNLINFRLSAAGYRAGESLFTDEAMIEIFNFTQGYPRRVAFVCHNALEMLVMQGKSMADQEMIYQLLEREMAWDV